MKKETTEAINSIIDKIAEKLEVPASTMSEAATYGFEKYADYIWALGVADFLCGISLIVLGIILLNMAVKIYLSGEYEGDSMREIVSLGAVIVLPITAAIIIPAGIYEAISGIPLMVEPEGAAVLEVIRKIR